MPAPRRMSRTPRQVRAEIEASKPRRTGAELDAAIKAISKKLGSHVIQRAADVRTAKRLPTGCFTFDLATCGGLPVQGMSEFHGIRSSGKTTKAYHTIAAAQIMYPDKICVLVDVERSFDPVWASKCGVDLDRLEVIQPDTGEDAVDIMEGMIRVEDVCLVVLDSIGAMVPHKEIDAAAEDQHVGIHAKLCTRMVRKINVALGVEKSRGHEVTVICINQQRAGIGKWAPPGQEAVSLPGGKALEHAFLVIARFKNKENMKKDSEGFDMLTVNEHAFKLEKNKICAGMRDGEYTLQRQDSEEFAGLTEGMIDNATTMLAYAKKMGVYTGGGRSWTLSIPDEEDITFQNTDAHIDNLYNNPLLLWKLRNHLIALHAAKLRMPDYFIEGFYGDDAPCIAHFTAIAEEELEEDEDDGEYEESEDVEEAD